MINKPIIIVVACMLIGCKEKPKTISDDADFIIEGRLSGTPYRNAIVDSLYDLYTFHANRRLEYYSISKKNAHNTAGTYFYENGKVKQIIITTGSNSWNTTKFYENGNIEYVASYREGLLNGSSYTYYPSGNLKGILFYINDSLRGYNARYYDQYNLKKHDYFSGYGSKNGFIYRRTYDSITQDITEIIDHRALELENHPNLTIDDLRLPWE